MRPLVDWLQYNGYTTGTKSIKRGFAGQPLANGAMDVELAVDALRLGRALDHVILFSGRVELKALVAALQEEGKRVTVVSSLANGIHVADEMRRQADQYVDLDELKDQIRLPPRDAARGHELWHGSPRAYGRTAKNRGRSRPNAHMPTLSSRGDALAFWRADQPQSGRTSPRQSCQAVRGIRGCPYRRLCNAPCRADARCLRLAPRDRWRGSSSHPPSRYPT